MSHTWITHNIVAHACDRQAALLQEAAHQRLLQQLPQPAERFILLRKTLLFTGNLLITSGTWLTQRATLEQRRVHGQPMSDHFSQVSQ